MPSRIRIAKCDQYESEYASEYESEYESGYESLSLTSRGNRGGVTRATDPESDCEECHPKLPPLL